jgi:hypothetical protein
MRASCFGKRSLTVFKTHAKLKVNPQFYSTEALSMGKRRWCQ